MIEQRAENFAEIYKEEDRHFAAQCYIIGATDQHELDKDKLKDILNALMIDTKDKQRIIEFMEK